MPLLSSWALGSAILQQERLPVALLDEQLPSWMNESTFAGLSLAQWLGMVLVAALAAAVGWLLERLALRLGQGLARRSANGTLLPLLRGPLGLFLGCLLTAEMLPALALGVEAASLLHSFLTCGVIFALAWLALRLLHRGSGLAGRYFTRGMEDTGQARAVQTQLLVVRAVLRCLVVIAAAALMLMQFAVAWSVGLSLLASASLAGVVLGFAANRTVATLFAGIQIAFTQTIRIGDEVVVEGEFGRIEDIRLTYVVVKLWDQRRLILPVTYFSEKPFQNWTTTATNLIGTVLLYPGYGAAIEEIRQELHEILTKTDLWDRQVEQAHVINLTETGVEVRLLVSAADSTRLWDLRCLVREKMLHWLQLRRKK
jgi:small-conductance mechanosensitive channel